MAGIREIVAVLSIVGATWCSAADREGIPPKLSKLDGWHGIHVARGKGCPTCCGLIFPTRFGAGNAAELRILVNLFRAEIVDDLSCKGIRVDYDVLAHIRRLAVELHDRDAALVLVDADTEGGLDLGGGELSEQHVVDDLVPLLRSYPEVERLLTPKRESWIVEQVCGASEFSDMDIPALVEHLRSKGAPKLAQKIRKTCGS